MNMHGHACYACCCDGSGVGRGAARQNPLYQVAYRPPSLPTAVAFGRVLEGVEILDRLSRLPADEYHRPRQAVVVRGSGLLPQHQAQ